jgi:hypothetical protein
MYIMTLLFAFALRVFLLYNWHCLHWRLGVMLQWRSEWMMGNEWILLLWQLIDAWMVDWRNKQRQTRTLASKKERMKPKVVFYDRRTWAWLGLNGIQQSTSGRYATGRTIDIAVK